MYWLVPKKLVEDQGNGIVAFLGPEADVKIAAVIAENLTMVALKELAPI